MELWLCQEGRSRKNMKMINVSNTSMAATRNNGRQRRDILATTESKKPTETRRNLRRWGESSDCRANSQPKQDTHDGTGSRESSERHK